MRCPHCCQQYGIEEMHFDPHPLLHGLHTFRPVFRRVIQHIAPRALNALRMPVPCPGCGTPMYSRLLLGKDMAHEFPTKGCYPAFSYLIFDCHACGQRFGSPCAIAGAVNPQIRAFMLNRSRWIVECSEPYTFQGSPALHTCLVDCETGARLTFFAHLETLEVLATFTE
jgi:hypothetical protein